MDAYDTYLVLTFVGETRILAISAEDELDEAEIDGFQSDTQVRRVAATHKETDSNFVRSRGMLRFCGLYCVIFSGSTDVSLC